MSFIFRYKPVRLRSGKIMQRPMIPLILEGKEKISIIGILDSGSDISIIPKEIAEVIGLEFSGENEIFGIAGIAVKSREAKINISFGKERETYRFSLPVLVPEKENVPIIIGRLGFFSQFKITFSEADRKIEFKKVNNEFLPQ